MMTRRMTNKGSAIHKNCWERGNTGIYNAQDPYRRCGALC
jgi:hypothetical protein